MDWMVISYVHRKWNDMGQGRVLADFWRNMKAYMVVNTGKDIRCVYGAIKKKRKK